MKPQLERETFSVSRELEYFSERELVAQTGYDKHEWWPLVLVKESVDNGLDACEEAGVSPVIGVCFGADGRELVVSDNGPGITADVLKRILDYSTRTSNKSAYVAPLRGTQGNAWKCILGIPFVLNGGKPATVVVESQGLKHHITVETDDVARRPVIKLASSEIVKNAGTTIRLYAFAHNASVTQAVSYKSCCSTSPYSTLRLSSAWC